MNNFTLAHLRNWIAEHVSEDEQLYLEGIIINFVDEYPAVLRTHSWPEIRRLAESENIKLDKP